MARIICDLPNASEEISGVKFTKDKGQMVSEEVSDDVAERFGRIDGYKVIASKPKGPAPKPSAAKDENTKTEPPAPPVGDGKDDGAGEEKTEDKGDGQ